MFSQSSIPYLSRLLPLHLSRIESPEMPLSSPYDLTQTVPSFCLKMPGKCLQRFTKETSVKEKVKILWLHIKTAGPLLEGKSQLSSSLPEDSCGFILDTLLLYVVQMTF